MSDVMTVDYSMLMDVMTWRPRLARACGGGAIWQR